MTKDITPPQKGPFQAAVQTLGDAVAEELGRILASARDYERQLRLAIADSCLLSRNEAALHLNASVGQVDRWAASGALEVVTLDRRPRFQLAELNRFASARSGKRRRRPNQRQSNTASSMRTNQEP